MTALAIDENINVAPTAKAINDIRSTQTAIMSHDDLLEVKGKLSRLNKKGRRVGSSSFLGVEGEEFHLPLST